MDWKIAVTIAFCIGLYLWVAYSRGFFPFKKAKKPNKTTASGIILPDTFPYQYTRPDGGYIFTVYPIPPDLQAEVLRRIVVGLQRSIDTIRFHNPTWTRMMRTVDFTVVAFIEPMATNRDGSPALLVGGHQSAGTVINVGYPDNRERGEPYIIAPAQRDWTYLDYLEATIYNEAEHAVEWVNDKAIFWLFTGGNDVHPHWAPVGQAVGLATSLETQAPCSVKLPARTKDCVCLSDFISAGS